jgi:CubicO group peptidase (beta-lactamase class C family)
MVIVRKGRIIWKGPGVDNIHELYSCSKVFTSTVLGVLATDGKLEVDDPVVAYYPELDDGPDGQVAYDQMTFRELVTMTSGYNSKAGDCWYLQKQGKFHECYICTQGYTIPGKPKFPPGTTWQYDDQDVHMLGYVLTRIAGRSLEEVFRERIAGRIGMVNWEWSDYGLRDGVFFNNPAGTPYIDTALAMNDIQGGIWTTPGEFARLGLLYLNYGRWKTDQLLDSSFVDRAMSNQVPVTLPFNNMDLAGRYGFYWWTNGIRKDGTRPWPSAPPRTAAAHGGSRNFCFVIPEWDMVIVRMSPRWDTPIPEHGDIIWESFFKILKRGLT